METRNFNSQTILIADDEEYVRQHLSRRLASLNLKVLQAGSGNEVLEIVNPLVDLIIMDVRMPAMDGLQTLEKIKENETISRIPVVLLSAIALQDDPVARSRVSAADEYIMKPITFDRLLESIRCHLG